WTFDPLFAVEVYVLARLAQTNPSDVSSSLEGTIQGQTYAGSLRLSGDGSGWTWGAEGSYELGHVDVLSAARAAWAASGHVARSFETAVLQPNVRVGVSYASGAGNAGGSATGTTYRAFDPLLADVHVWHGAMDVFTASNEGEVSARVGVVPFSDGSAAIEYRYARLAQASGEWRSDNLASLGQKSGGSADLGHEIDATIAWSPWTGVVVDAGYSIFVLGDGAREILGPAAAKTSHFAFAQASVTF
ncbi:MAG TPA: alginate export family protein, partial [Polyangiaceae bacterium]|nr:alginate export family protein [Polyangiaceae bacterium]